MILPQEFQSLIDYAETVRKITDVPAKPVPCMNVVACGGPGTGKLTATRAYGAALLAQGFIKNEPVYIDCAVAVSPKQLQRVMSTTMGLHANGGMVIFDNAHILQEAPFNVAATFIERAKNGCVLALVGERAGVEQVLRSHADLAVQFPTIMDADNRAEQRRQDELRQNAIDATVLKADVTVGKPLQLRKPEVLK
jgi:hypothetical protein